MSKYTNINTLKTVYPQIYAYILPNRSEDNGWIKIGYTERKDVNERIREQTETAAFKEEYKLLWSEPAKFYNKDSWFKDQQFHSYLTDLMNIKRRPNTEWFYFGSSLSKSLDYFEDFIHQRMPQRQRMSQRFKLNPNQSNYILRDEQSDAVNQTLSYEKNHHGSKFLWNAKPRFGKTLSTYDLMRKMGAKNVLIVTNRPAIANSWFDDFEKFIAWQTNYKFISTSESLKGRPVLTYEQYLKFKKSDSKQITFISLQDLKGAISFGGKYNKLKWVNNLNWDLLVIDEAHEGIETDKSSKTFNNISRNFTLYLSGTPFKELEQGNFLNEQIYSWTYSDEQIAKKKWDYSRGNNPYEKLPKLNLFSYQMSRMITDKVNQGAQIDGDNVDYAFDLNEFFETNGKNFIHENAVKKWLDTLSTNIKYPFSTPKLRNKLKHTLWILNRVDSAKKLKTLLSKHPVFKDYKVILAAGNDSSLDGNAYNSVEEAIEDNDKTITLSVGQLTTGVTIPEWTAIMMLSNIKSPSLYIQASFRAQNPWIHKENGQWEQKDNAYVFDFSPERTLTIYDNFANNLSSDTVDGHGPTKERKENIKKLLNFFPVIAEDSEGKMTALDENKILTIPKSIRSNEVVNHGFMSNLLFQNISQIFSSDGALEILNKLHPEKKGKVNKYKKPGDVQTGDVHVDKDDNTKIDSNIQLGNTNANFGPKYYSNFINDSQDTIDNNIYSSPKKIAKMFKNNTKSTARNIAHDNDVNMGYADKVVNKYSNIIRDALDSIKKQLDTDQKGIDTHYSPQIKVAKANNNLKELEQIKAKYYCEKENNENDNKEQMIDIIKNKVEKSKECITSDILKKNEESKRSNAENDTRARLRGFSRTIPSFLMAYGSKDTTLNNFDLTVNDDVFKEVTGINLSQFRQLRDDYHFFNEIVFNESVRLFMDKRQELSNYFNNNDEDIFDYIPPQNTNQIYTPKNVVKSMIDSIEKNNPGIFNDPNKTFIDLYMKSGLYITEIVKRLYVGLKDKIPDDDQRLKHILENQVYGCAPTDIIYNIAHNFIFGFNEHAKNIDDSHIIRLDTTPYAEGNTKISLKDKLDEIFTNVNY